MPGRGDLMSERNRTNSIEDLKPDQGMIRHYLRVLGIGPSNVTELRILNAVERGSSSSWPVTISGYYDDPEALIKDVLRTKSATGFYTLLNPCVDDLLARRSNRAARAGKGETTHDKEILCRKWLPIDFDAVRPSGISSTEEEHQAALDRALEVATHLKAEGWPTPVFGDSGNGGHLLYPIDLPLGDDGYVENCLKALHQRFSDDKVKIDVSVANPARIWKLYGTPVRKGDSTPKRPHRMARLLKVPDGF